MIRLFYHTDPNFGDAMSPLIVERLSSQKVCASNFWKADMMAVGSVFYRGNYLIGDLLGKDSLRYAKAMIYCAHAKMSSPVKVWGSGFLQLPSFKKPFFTRRIKVYALRGKLTRSLLDRLGLTNPSDVIPYGDPGLLYAKLFGVKPMPEYDLGIVPHICDKAQGAKIFKLYQDLGLNVALIDVVKPPYEVVSSIAKCRRILSSSLHGLIVADSLSIPNAHVVLSTLGHSKDDFELKFRDYYSAFSKEMPAPVESENILAAPHKILEDKYYSIMCTEHELGRCQATLVESFPDMR